MSGWLFFSVFLVPFFITWGLVKFALRHIGSHRAMLIALFAYASLTVFAPLAGGIFYLTQIGQSKGIVWMCLLVLLSRLMELLVLKNDNFFQLVRGDIGTPRGEVFADEQIYQYPNGYLLLFASLLVLFAWCILAIFIFYFLFYLLGASLPPVLESLSLPLVGALVFFGLMYIVVGSRLRCIQCGNHILIENNLPKHPLAHRIKGFSYWATVVIDILFRRQFACMYCGQRYITTNKALRN